MGAVILVFAKAPVAGRVKTRLIPALGAEGALALQQQLVSGLLTHLEPFGEVILSSDQPTSAWPEFTGPREVQAPGDLGDRMRSTFDHHLSNACPVLILGGDVPPPPIGHLEELLHSAADVTLGPADDGGYYAISCRRTHPAMFRGVVWSSGGELDQTRRACEEAGLTVRLGPPWFDIDTPEDLERARGSGIV